MWTRISLTALLLGLGLYSFGGNASGDNSASKVRATPKPVFKGWKINGLTERKNSPFWQAALRDVQQELLDPDLAARRQALMRITRPSVSRASTPHKIIALTFDDGPHPAYTPRLLALLKAENVKATFFLVGRQCEANPDLVFQIADEGHCIGNHSFSHVQLNKRTPEMIKTEYLACQKVIQSITGLTPSFCRPPGGDLDDDVIACARWAGLTTVLWTANAGDFKSPGVEKITRNALKISPGGIILMHSGIDQTMQALPGIIRAARKMGYVFVTLDQMFAPAKQS